MAKTTDDTIIQYVDRRISEGFEKLQLPTYMYEGVMRYVMHGIKPGDFLMGILTNDLSKAVMCADNNNQRMILEWGRFALWYLPSMCWGDKLTVQRWRGMENVPMMGEADDEGEAAQTTP